VIERDGAISTKVESKRRLCCAAHNGGGACRPAAVGGLYESQYRKAPARPLHAMDDPRLVETEVALDQAEGDELAARVVRRALRDEPRFHRDDHAVLHPDVEEPVSSFLAGQPGVPSQARPGSDSR